MKTSDELLSFKGKVAVVIGGTGVLCAEKVEGVTIAGVTVMLSPAGVRNLDQAGGRENSNKKIFIPHKNEWRHARV